MELTVGLPTFIHIVGTDSLGAGRCWRCRGARSRRMLRSCGERGHGPDGEDDGLDDEHLVGLREWLMRDEKLRV